MQTPQKTQFSVVIPAFNEAENLGPLAQALDSVLTPLGTWEAIFVDDGSTDDSAAVLRALQVRDSRLGFIILSRNFGKEAAILAGISSVSGAAVIVMDADLQHPPGALAEMIAIWRSGKADVVDGIKRSRGRESAMYGFAAGIFNRAMSGANGKSMRGASDFKLIDRRVADAIAAFPERVRFFRGLTDWAGFRHAGVEYDVAPRRNGTSAWKPAALVRYSISNLVSFSSAPLRAISTLGLVTTAASLALGIDTLYMKLSGRAVEGFTTVLLSVAFFSGAIILCLGIMGEYLSRMYDELKRRPGYIVKETSSGKETRDEI
jgi:dolichol-phosphate mannosyltransferase